MSGNHYLNKSVSLSTDIYTKSIFNLIDFNGSLQHLETLSRMPVLLLITVEFHLFIHLTVRKGKIGFFIHPFFSYETL